MTSDSFELPPEATAGQTLDELAAPPAPTGDLATVDAAAAVMEDRCSSGSGSVSGDPIAIANLGESSSLQSSSSFGSHASAAEAPGSPQHPAPAAAAEHASSSAEEPTQALKLSAVELLAADTASEVQQMAAKVLQRKQQHNHLGNHRTAAARVGPQDPLHLLNNSEKGLKARKEQLLSALRNSGDGASARVAAVKEELAGVQARLRDALGLRESSASGHSAHDELDYRPPLHKRSSFDYVSPTSSHDGTPGSGTHKTHRLVHSNAAAAASGNILGPKAAALQINKPAKQSTAAVAPTGAAARARAAGGDIGASDTSEASIPTMYYDRSSEVAAMAAQVLQRRNPAAGLS